MDTLALAGIPLYGDVGSKGGYQLLPDYRWDHRFLNKTEGALLATFLKCLETTVPYQDVINLSNKFDFTQDQGPCPQLVMQLGPRGGDEKFQAFLKDLTRARETRHKVLIHYYDIDLKPSQRTIAPHTLLLFNNLWYVYAFCDLRKDFRMFKLYRIVSCQVLEETFDLQVIDKPYPWSNYQDDTRPTTLVKLKIDLCLQGRLPDYFDPKECQIKEDGIYVNMNYPIDEWVYQLLLGLVPHVEILSPDHIRANFVNRLKKALHKNNYDI